MSQELDILDRFPAKRMLALINRVGGPDAADTILSGEKNVKLEDALAVLFNQHGQRIRLQVFEKPFVDPNRNYRVEMGTSLADAARLARYAEHLKQGTLPSHAEYVDKAGALRRQIEEADIYASCRNLFKGPHFAGVLPKMIVTAENFGNVLEEAVLTTVDRAYKAQFSGRPFNNYHAGTLAGQVGIASGSRHADFLARLANGLVWWYFPTALQGYGIEADWEQMATLPKGFILAGALDIGASIALYPDLLAKNGMTPAYDCAANTWRGRSLCFSADVGDLGFRGRRLDAGGDGSGGLVFVG